jgi:hypothetical protein
VDGISGWRLPTTVQPDPNCYNQNQSAGYSYGYNCTGSEMGHLFYNELGGVLAQSIWTTHNSNYNLFTNVQSNPYWSATEYSANLAWQFSTNNGAQNTVTKGDYGYAWAVHPGDVGAVPVPAAVWLFGSGLLGLFGVARRKAA